MKSSREALLTAAVALVCLITGLLAARAAMPEWIQNIDSRSLMEAAIFRTVSLPRGPVTVRRPPSETVAALSDLLKQHPQQADLYSLKALEEEQKLDFTAAEADWKLYVQKASGPMAQIALADFYHRRNRPQDEVTALSAAARMPSSSSEKLVGISDQRSWHAFERIFQVIQAQALGKNLSIEQYNAWVARYPQEPGLYGRYFEFLLNDKDFKAASDLIARYHAAFPNDEVFSTRARALLAYRQGSIEEGLAIYEKNFQPLWPPELIKNYFDLVRETRNQRKFLDQARAALVRNPDDLNAAARIFYYHQQRGDLPAAQQAVTDYRLKKDARKAVWTAQELYTFARLLDAMHLYPEAARYYYALYNVPDADSPEKALAGLTNILLAAPEQPVRFGTGDISMYQDITTMDPGPGYLNGILSLILNTTSPASHYAEEEQRAVPYFHRSRAAEMVALFDKRFPASGLRAELHARLIDAYAHYGEDAAVLIAGSDFLNAFPSAPQRNQVALQMADAYARGGNTKGEFAIYDSLLQELARKAEGVPLGEGFEQPVRSEAQSPEMALQGNSEGEGEESEEPPARQGNRGLSEARRQALAVQKTASVVQGVRSPEYQRVLDRYIARLVSLRQLPAALAVWRQELDRNPNDPGLYEKFARFLEGNQLGTEEEAVYKRAIQQFQKRSWYHKLARWYLSKKREQDVQALSQEVLRIFSGSELEGYLRDLPGMPLQLELRFNQLAHERFPHNLTFVRNLLALYHSKRFYDHASWEALLRNYWFADETLRNRFFEYLSSEGQLESELQAVKSSGAGNSDWPAQAAANPVSVRFVAEAELWRSHFEAGAPLIAAVARQYPADVDLGQRASSVYRSLAYVEPRNTEIAVQIENNLLQAAPADRERLARVGDIYSDREQFSKAAAYWNRMPDTEPGRAQSYEDAATVFWDYYFFEDALRLLNLGRTRLHDGTLYSYQVGAIYENQKDYVHAVNEYVKGSLAEPENAEARARLVQLATRKSSRDAVDAATDKAVVTSNYDLAAIQLRVEVLGAEQRTQDIASFLTSALDHSNSVETLESIESMAREKSLEAVRQHALERQAAVSADPIRRLELRYALVSFYEQKNDLAAAQQNVDSLYKENPRIMGVVRSTVDFYWRNKQQQRAIDILTQAAKDSYPALKTRFTFEAARKMTETGQYEPARRLLLTLIQAEPYNGEYLAAVAEAYARANDNAGLRDFYQDKIKAFQKSNLPGDERKTRIATLRRGLIPALTALKDYSGAVDQYIEIINAFPDDAGLVSEATNYAQRYQRKDQLLNFYAKTVSASPKDSRWAVVLARVQAGNEDFDAAIRTYAQAIRVRPDRADLLTAKAAMEERLLRFDDAVADYTSLYELAYHDPKWMEKVAETRARQNRPELVVQALKIALVDGRAEGPGKYFAVAVRLEGWGILEPAREYAEKGIAVAGADLLADSENHAGAETYARVMTRLRRQEAAFQKLQAAMEGARQLPPLTQRVARNGVEAVTNAELSKSLLSARTGIARNGMSACMREIGVTVNRFFTPEEKVEFAKSLDARNAAMTRSDAYDFLLPVAEKGGIADLQARLTYEAALSRSDLSAHASRLEDLQTRRLKLKELGQQLEHIAAARSSVQQHAGMGYLAKAREIYRLAGNEDDEFRLLDTTELGRQQQDRYFELLLARDPQRMLRLPANPKAVADDKANYVVAHADGNLALAAVAARSAFEPAVWRPAYTALVGLYFRNASPQIQNAFIAALGDGTIGERLAHAGDRKQTLAGDVWFYYGSRYGEYLGMTRKGDPEDFLPAEIEHTPVAGAAYFDAAYYYEDAGDLNRAISDYLHVADLSPERIDVHNRLAGIYWKQKRQDMAQDEWKRALELLKRQTASGSIPETFWGDFAATVNSLASHKLLVQFQPGVREILHNYVKRNGNYRLLPLLRATLPGLESPGAASALLLDLAADAPEKVSFLRQFISDRSGLKIDLEPIYRRLLDLTREAAQKSEGVAKEYAQQQFESLQIQWLQFLLAGKQYDRLRSELGALSKPVWERHTEHIAIQLKLAAQTATLDTVIAGYRADEEHAPAADVLRNPATELQQAGDRQSAQKILEFVFTREIEQRNLTAANMLGLAEIRIQAGDLDAGVALLKRMTLVAGGPFENQDAAAALLLRTGHPAQALSFLQELAKAVPWNAQYRGRLAEAQIAANQDVELARRDLAAVVSDRLVVYEDRVALVDGLQGAAAGSLGSAELDYLARGPEAHDSLAADQPFFFHARMKAIEGLPAQERIKLLRGGLDYTPAGDAARIPLLKAASEAGDYHLAIAAMQPYLTGASLVNIRDSEQGVEGDEDVITPQSPAKDPARAFTRLPAKERAEVSRLLGTAFERTRSPAQAIAYLRSAYRLEPDSVAKAQINRQVQQIRFVQRRQEANRARQPMIHSELEQQHIVRPRLPERPVASPPTSLGRVQKGVDQ